jgi:hypothetical protein
MSDDAMTDEPPQTTRHPEKPPWKTAADGRIVVTLKYKMSKDTRLSFLPPNNDAVDCLRQLVADYERGEVSLAHLVASACEIQVTAAK